MKGKQALLFCFLLLPLFFAGCWSRNEVENLAMVGGVGIDTIQENGKTRFLVTYNIFRPGLAGGGPEAGGGGRGQPAYWRMMAAGDTLVDAERNLNLRAPRRIFYGHARYVIMGESVARDHLRHVLDYLLRHPEIRLRTLVLVYRGKAVDAMIKFPELENTTSRQFTQIASITSFIVSKVRIRDLAETTDQLIAPGIDPVIAEVATPLVPPTVPGTGNLPVFYFAGGGVVRQDKLAGWLGPVETRGYLIAVNQARQGILPVPIKNGTRPDTSINLTRTTSKLKVRAEGDTVTAIIVVHAEGDVGEESQMVEIATTQEIPVLEKKFEEEIKNEIRAAFNKAQELNADIFGLGAGLRRSDAATWKRLEKDWYKILPAVQVELKVTAHIRRTGMIANPYEFK